MSRKIKKSLIKWTILIVLSCIAYLAGTYWGNKQVAKKHVPTPTPLPSYAFIRK